MPKTCDNASVGVIITTQFDDGPRYLMFTRVTPPIGVAPCAGHVDDHGSPEDAAIAEVSEELGLTVTRLNEAASGWLPNRCRRDSGSRGIGHQWTIFTAGVVGQITPSPREAREPRWVTVAEIAALAGHTLSYGRGEVSPDEFAADPGLEPVWVVWLSRLGVLDATGGELDIIHQLYH